MFMFKTPLFMCSYSGQQYMLRMSLYFEMEGSHPSEGAG